MESRSSLLDGAKILGAILLFTAHAFTVFEFVLQKNERAFQWLFSSYWDSILCHGAQWVDFFFVLAGFGIYKRLYTSKNRKPLSKKFFNVFATFFLAQFVVCSLWLLVRWPHGASLDYLLGTVGSLFFINNWMPLDFQPAPWSWFLSACVQMCLLLPLMRWALKRNQLSLVIGLIITVPLILRGLVIEFKPILPVFLSYHFKQETSDFFQFYHMNTFLRVTPFFLGALIAHYNWHELKVRNEVRWLMLAFAVLAHLFVFSYFEYLPQNPYQQEKMQNPLFLMFWYPITTLAGVCVFMFCMWSKDIEKKLKQFKFKNPIHFLGNLTLPFVLFHIPMQLLSFRWLGLSGPSLLHMLLRNMFVAFMITFLISVLFELSRKKLSKIKFV